MKTKSPLAARCPVPAKLPEPLVMLAARGTEGRTVIRHKRNDFIETENVWPVVVIALHRRPSKAQLLAVQRWLNGDINNLLIKADKAYWDHVAQYGSGGLLAAFRATGLHHKPGQHAGEKGRR